jgi:hypothetical protein
VLTEGNIYCINVFYTVLYLDDDPRGSKHVALINAINLAVVTVLILFVYYTKTGRDAYLKENKCERLLRITSERREVT